MNKVFNEEKISSGLWKSKESALGDINQFCNTRYMKKKSYFIDISLKNEE